MIVIQEKNWNDLKPYKTFLEHYGRQNMRWYQHIFGKYQNHAKYSKGSSSGSDKKTKAKEEKKAANEAKAKAKAEKKAADEAAKKEKQRKDNLSSPTKLYKHRKEYTYDEINNAIKRFDLEKRLADLSQSNLDRGANFIKTLVNYTENGVKLYNNAAKIINSLNGDDALKIIKGFDKSDKKENKNNSSDSNKNTNQDTSNTNKRVEKVTDKLTVEQAKYNIKQTKFNSQKLTDEMRQYKKDKKKK